ncbi:hypothetical protein [Amycolatopsis coloradensis]|uniref:hypothetical protein n=1 Tax=Amycolatopsis coloradensis TaxID=76021 RepID=UPI001178A88F|nr:hypothetical protein [Amycolatopsis coloradensis]
MRRTLGRISATIASVVAAFALLPAGQAVADAKQCIKAPGPGTYNEACMYIYGNSTWVDKVEVWLSATHVMPPIIYPADICRSKLDVWGRSSASGHWEQTYTHQGCHTGTQGALFTAEKNAVSGSYVCSRTTWDGKASDTNCFQIWL